MKKRNKFIVTDNTAKAQTDICEHLYSKSMQSVYTYADNVKMAYSKCNQCENETPTIITVKTDTCAVCGSGKLIQKQY